MAHFIKKILIVKHITKIFLNSKDSEHALVFSSSFSGCLVISNFVLFHSIKIAKNICDMIAQTGS